MEASLNNFFVMNEDIVLIEVSLIWITCKRR